MVKVAKNLPTVESVMKYASGAAYKLVGDVKVYLISVLKGDVLANGSGFYVVSIPWCFAVVSVGDQHTITADAPLGSEEIWLWLRECQEKDRVIPFMSEEVKGTLSGWTVDVSQLASRVMTISCSELDKNDQGSLVVVFDYEGANSYKAELFDKELLPYLHYLLVKDGLVKVVYGD